MNLVISCKIASINSVAIDLAGTLWTIFHICLYHADMARLSALTNPYYPDADFQAVFFAQNLICT